MKRVALITTLVLAAGLALASSALAGQVVSASPSGWVGPYDIGYASCLNSSYVGNFITVPTPLMAAVNATGNLDSQQVSWQAFLFRWNGQSWQQVQATPAEYAWATDQKYASFPSTSRSFYNLSSGYYSVAIHMMWYASASVAYGGMATVVPAMAYAFGNLYPNNAALCTIN